MAEQAGFLGNIQSLRKSGIGIPIVLIMFILVMVLPLPSFLLDILFTFNISLALLVILAAIYSQRPLDFAVFPTILLLTTLFRLALNVASTRIVLLKGHTGQGAAGDVIRAFGEVVIGGSYTVGLVVFCIFIIINFVVVTKGAGRISEVSARFMLDAMPGKQMAIDADVNSGMITQEEAAERRKEVASEADFYGSMDGASKFVRGDAVAGILILLINLVGGFTIGMAQHGLTFSKALENYALLTIGDGLVAQIPALLLSTAAAIMVTRVSHAQDVGQQVVSQVFSSSKVLIITACILIGLGLVPGMPHVAFIGIGSVVAALAYWTYVKEKNPEAQQLEPEVDDKLASSPEVLEEVNWEDVVPVDPIALEVGLRLIPLVDVTQGGQLTGRIKSIRKKISQDLGFLIPHVHIRDNLDLSPNGYRITLKGVTIAEADIEPKLELAINPGQVSGDLDGVHTKDPSFGLDATWIDPELKEQAQTMGYTVVDSSTVIATHLSQTLQNYANELFGHQEAQEMLKKLEATASKLAEDLVPSTLPMSVLVKVLQKLLEEHIPIKDFRTIAETLAESGSRTKDPDELTSAVRVALSRLIVQNISEMEEELPVITLNPNLEQVLLKTRNAGEAQSAALEPGLAEKLQQSLLEYIQRQELSGNPAVLLVAPTLRPMLAKFAKIAAQGLHVLSYQEIPDNRRIKIVGTVG